MTSLMNRREMLMRAGSGFGMLGLAGMLQSAQTQRPHFPAKAKRVIFLFMNGAPSHVDTFDPKPGLKKYEGQSPKDKLDREVKGGYLPSPFEFKPHGHNGVVLSELFPELAKCADDLLRRPLDAHRAAESRAWPAANAFGQSAADPPIAGIMDLYGLGTLNANLPAFVVLAPRRPVVGPHLWSSSFLPGAHQGMAVNTTDMRVDHLVANLRSPDLKPEDQKKQLSLLQQINKLHLEQRPEDAALEAQIRALETAFLMQGEASDAFDIGREPARMRARYGDTLFGQSCLLARRLCERGVRFVQVYYLTPNNNQPWDTHADNDKRHRELCADSDRATAALLTDLKVRGMLDDTLVVWGGEFGRTPYAQPAGKGNPGRDHHHTAFSMLLAGGGIRGGLMHDATDDVGMHAVENRVHVHDLHATILHQLGIDHEKLTYRYSGRDFRLTDVHGRVVKEVIA